MILEPKNGKLFYSGTNIQHRKPLMVMPSNHNSMRLGYWLGKRYNVGWLISQPIEKTNIKDYNDIIPYALDNGRFACWSQQKEWDVGEWIGMLELCSMLKKKPMWAVVPDVVGDKVGTLKDWEKYYYTVAMDYRLPPAFAVQDGMTPEEVPELAEVIFVGGTFDWKWKTAEMWCKEFPRVHIARVNTMDRLWKCHDWGAESVDGTGWFRDGANAKRMRVLEDYFENNRTLQMELI